MPVIILCVYAFIIIQVCSNGARVYVHENIFDEFMEKIEVAVRKLRVGDTMDSTAQIGALISKEHFEKVSKFVEGAKQEVHIKHFLETVHKCLCF